MSLIRYSYLSSMAMTLLSWSALAASENLAVYYPTGIPVQDRQKILKNETKLEVTVFSKFSEFEDFVKDKNPNLLIAPSSFSLTSKTYRPALKLTEKGHDEFKYVLISLTNKWTNQNVNAAKLGVVQELDREALKDYFNRAFGTQIKVIKYVSRLEDLFSLLVFESADVIALSSYNYDQLKSQFTTNVVKVLESKPAQPPYVYVKSDLQDNLDVTKLMQLPEKALGALGFSKVETLQTGALQ